MAVRRLPRGIWNLKGVAGGGSEVSGGGKIDNGGQELRRVCFSFSLFPLNFFNHTFFSLIIFKSLKYNSFEGQL